MSFAVACAGCLALFFVGSHAPLSEELRRLSWTAPAVGLAVLAIETGFLLAYRAGWKLGVSSLIVTALVTLILVPVGRVFFHERLSGAALLGAGFVLAGLALLAGRTAPR